MIGESFHNITISIHALREEGDRAGSVRGMAVNLFLSTPSARRATCTQRMHPPHLTLFLSTPSARRATTGKQRLR